MLLQVPPRTVGGAYLTLDEDTQIEYRVDCDGNTLEFVVLGPMELGIGMTPTILQRWQALFAEALADAHRAQREPVEVDS